jgi:hypothetical protein
LGIAVVSLVGGCGGKPVGVDGNLTNNWSGMPAATLPVPADRACYPIFQGEPGKTKLPPPVDCASQHTVETIKVGTFGGDDGARDSPPPGGGPGQQQAYADCAKTARDHLGADWRDGRLGLDVVLPTSAQWDAEARWYRCDLVEFKDIDSLEVVSRGGTLRGALAGARPLALTCFKVSTKAEDIDTMAAVDCATAHNGEYTGTWEAPAGVYPADGAAREKAQLDGCRKVVADFTGVPNDDKVRYRIGQITFGFGKAAWDMGNRGSRCYLWMNDKTYTKSLKGAGTNGLPINYA